MSERLRSLGPVLLSALILSSACGRPKPSSMVSDFSRRHDCPESRVETLEKGSNRMLIVGCGQSEMYVRRCSFRASAGPANETPRPVLTKEEARYSSVGRTTSEPSTTGCAWSREDSDPVGIQTEAAQPPGEAAQGSAPPANVPQPPGEAAQGAASPESTAQPPVEASEESAPPENSAQPPP